MEPTTPTTPPPSGTPAQSASGKAITALVLGILSILCCGLLGPIAWILGSSEGKAIAAGQSAAAGETIAKVGMILGIIGTVLLVLSLAWMFFAGGMAVLQGLAQS